MKERRKEQIALVGAWVLLTLSVTGLVVSFIGHWWQTSMIYVFNTALNTWNVATARSNLTARP